jgi:DNA-binding PadR family transcriptional regulator
VIRYALLGLLRERPDYGYHLKRRFDERVGALWQLNVGQVYQTLRSLERAGLVEAASEDSDDHPSRRLYALTTKGLRALARWSERPARRPQPIRDETLVCLLLAAPERREELLVRLDEQEQVYRRHLAKLVAERLRRGDYAATVADIGVEAALLHTEAQLKWLGVCRARLRELPTTPTNAAG